MRIKSSTTLRFRAIVRAIYLRKHRSYAGIEGNYRQIMTVTEYRGHFQISSQGS